MSRSTGPILAVGGITMLNNTVFHGKPLDLRIPLATGFAVAGFSLAERAWPDGAVALAWLALVAVLLTRTDKNTPSPIETINDWFSKGK